MLALIILFQLFKPSLGINKAFDGTLNFEVLLEWGFTTNVEDLNLQNNNIRTIEINTFKDFRNVTILLLSTILKQLVQKCSKV